TREALEGLAREWPRGGPGAAERRELHVLVGAEEAHLREERRERLAHDGPRDEDARVGGAQLVVRRARARDEGVELGVAEDLPPPRPRSVRGERDAARRAERGGLGHDP